MKGLSKGRYDETFAGEDGNNRAAFIITQNYKDINDLFMLNMEAKEIKRSNWSNSK